MSHERAIWIREKLNRVESQGMLEMRWDYNEGRIRDIVFISKVLMIQKWQIGTSFL